MKQYLIIGNGKAKNSITLLEYTVTDHIHSMYDDEQTAQRMADWLNKVSGLQWHVEERIFNLPA